MEKNLNNKSLSTVAPQFTMYISHYDYHSKIQFCHIRNQSLIFSLDVLGTCLIVRDILVSLTITLRPILSFSVKLTIFSSIWSSFTSSMLCSKEL